MTSVSAELNEKGNRIEIRFSYSPSDVAAAKKIENHQFVPREKGGPAWAYPADLTTGRRLREAFGDRLELGAELKAWGREEKQREFKLKTLSQAEDAELSIVPNDFQWRDGAQIKTLHPFQRADIAFMAESNALNANQPGSGKTAEVVLATVEAGRATGMHLALAPVSSLETAWSDEIKSLYAALREQGVVSEDAVVLTGDTPNARRAAIATAVELSEQGKGFWLVLNPAMARKKTVDNENDPMLSDGKVIGYSKLEVLSYPELAEISWDSLTIDEFHLMGLGNPKTLGSKGVLEIRKQSDPDMVFALSGTPMGGKPIKLWGGLRQLEPAKFTSRWQWARQWLEINHNGYGSTIEGIKRGYEDDFYDHLKPYLVRRTKAETLPGLEPKQIINVKCKMTAKQRKQYDEFAADAEMRIDTAEEEGQRMSATSILAEYTRLKQFASAFCDVTFAGLNKEGDKKFNVQPTRESGKIEQLLEKLAEEGVSEGEAKAIVSSQFTGMVHSVADLLNEKFGDGFAAVIDGGTKVSHRNAIVRAFQQGRRQQVKGSDEHIDPSQVIVINTKAGGVSLTMDQADSVHLLDETWNPDDQEQVEDRAHRASNMDHNVRCYYYRSIESIEQKIQQVVKDKQLNNETILDLRRMMNNG